MKSARFRAQNADRLTTVCSACLATDRLVYSLQETPQYVDICNRLSLSKVEKVCFECHARLHNIFRFRYRALQAQSFLSNRTCYNVTKHLSSLTHSIISTNSTIFLGDSGDLLQIKDEDEEEAINDVIVEPLYVSAADTLKAEECEGADENSIFDTKSERGEEDDSRTDTASENDEDGERPPRIEEPPAFVKKEIGHSELVAYMDRERKTHRFQKAQYKCDKCVLMFTAEKYSKSHNVLHSEEQGPFKCKVCEQRFKDDVELKSHVSKHYCRYECCECNHVDYLWGKINYHFKTMHDTTPRFCTKCPARFTKFTELRMHMRSAHARTLRCPKCDIELHSKSSMRLHFLRKHTKASPAKCSMCHKEYKGEHNLQRHIRHVHNKTTRRQRFDENAYCAECNMPFKDIYQYRLHLNTGRHVSRDCYRYECDHCGNKFAQKQSLRHHIEVMHIKVSRHKCDVCQQSFRTRVYLTRHKRLKHQPRKMKDVCHICGKGFTIRKSLDQHMNTHLGLRPYVCKHCGATFAYSAALFTHNRLVHLKRKRGKAARVPVDSLTELEPQK